MSYNAALIPYLILSWSLILGTRIRRKTAAARSDMLGAVRTDEYHTFSLWTGESRAVTILIVPNFRASYR